MNPLELACISGSHKLLSYFLEGDCKLGSRKDFQMTAGKLVEEMYFLVVPIIKKDRETLKILLDLPHLWTTSFWSILNLLKQTSWTDGLLLALSSNTA